MNSRLRKQPLAVPQRSGEPTGAPLYVEQTDKGLRVRLSAQTLSLSRLDSLRQRFPFKEIEADEGGLFLRI